MRNCLLLLTFSLIGTCPDYPSGDNGRPDPPVQGSDVPMPVPASSKTFETLWADLGRPSAPIAYQAIVALSKNPEGVPEFLYQRMKPSPTVSHVDIDKAITDLDAGSFAKRQKATHELKKVGKYAEKKLREVLKTSPSTEVESRVRELLQALEQERVRDVRAVEALERIGNEAAYKVLQKLAAEWPGTLLAEEMQSSLKRMAKPSGSAKK